MVDDASEWTEASVLRPVAHWVCLPAGDGRTRLGMIWEVPDPLPPTDPSVSGSYLLAADSPALDP